MVRVSTNLATWWRGMSGRNAAPKEVVYAIPTKIHIACQEQTLERSIYKEAESKIGFTEEKNVSQRGIVMEPCGKSQSLRALR